MLISYPPHLAASMATIIKRITISDLTIWTERPEQTVHSAASDLGVHPAILDISTNTIGWNIFTLPNFADLPKNIRINFHIFYFPQLLVPAEITRAVVGQRARLLGTFYIVTFLSLSHII